MKGEESGVEENGVALRAAFFRHRNLAAADRISATICSRSLAVDVGGSCGPIIGAGGQKNQRDDESRHPYFWLVFIFPHIVRPSRLRITEVQSFGLVRKKLHDIVGENVMALVFEAIETEGLAEISYLVGDDEEGVAAVFDPRAGC